MFKRILVAAAVMGLGLLGNAATAQNIPAAALAKLPESARRAFNQSVFDQRAAALFARLGADDLPFSLLREGLVGFYNVRAAGRAAGRPVLTLVDFSRSSQHKRLWVIDVAAGRVLFHTLVAHGKASGGDLPVAFSNQEGSEMSSLGFYRTAPATYVGKHGLSLKLHGLDPGFNTNAESRAVVVHGADYVCEEFVRAHGRLGRSQGCPALPAGQAAAIVQAIKGGSVLYLHGPAQAGYHSRWLDVDGAVASLATPGGGSAGN
ncbi:murein L,D-transpeptidase catalytic domain family protein [Hymenobacter sp. DH14]|uniref:Murein L,D-transpeptidase catalytic domain family protein n=1 Tax=Hymenobacter cyanobacteriorum TaxID=2926463 RepID=A0A9X2AGG9_9BACT|nr:murein L,D-transpeptidase catalytic domain family protein [Hymenobacter cyanobacteriorum]MCI1187643.1 murein L,D-transpeptidase catalytic domain family protein [Hymenobacter cyanobacteriorum]